MSKNIIPKDFILPEVLETKHFRLRMLTVNDVVKDYDAVMTSIEHLQKTKPFGPKQNWPTKELSFEQNLIDLGWHQKEFQNRSSFTFTIMRLDESECLGSVYIFPTDNPNYDVISIMWVRQSEVENNLDEILFSSVKKWIKDKWPFERVAYLGRDISWDEFE